MFETLTTLFRARSAEAEEALIDRNAVTLLAQHLRDAKAEIAGARAAIARLMAREAERDRAFAALAETLARREREAAAALAKGDEELAADLAEAILKLEDRRAEEAAAQKTLRARIAEAREALEGAERRFSDLADELRFAKEARLTRRAVGSPPPRAGALDKAAETAAALKAQTARMDDMAAAWARLDREAAAEDLDARVAAAGLDDEREARRRALMDRIAAAAEKTEDRKQGDAK